MPTQDRPTSRASKEQERAEADARYFAARDAAWDAVEAKTARLRAMRLEREAAAEQVEVAAKPVKKAAGRIRRH
jgi:hypothetical protein